ncbi:hypothetical protein SM0020_12360 [Sinorhizobium meliloti CCNWSX0020]|uniref:Uncharacterized protein n=1 Tax=Sinorhizobium meliloti CCNWSX0020 TaxID=1107881 RepID=H0FZ38_RHIML|nr:hypothetical protein SM0020_12360 [Sinorhizobium meliloti CCNWSX0020]
MFTLVLFTAFILAMLIGLMVAALDAQFGGK